MQPFLKWPGGKRWFISKYHTIFPNNYNSYFEPFLGGGSLFFYLEPPKATIADINSDLTNTYRMMAQQPKQLRTLLENHQKNHSETYYYKIRDVIPTNPLDCAARFIYLNRTCFNGMYRENKNGVFNVPIGTRDCFIEDVDQFDEYARILKNTSIRTQDFVDTIRDAAIGDFIFADPPYTIAQNQNSFIKYNGKLFSWKDQMRLLRALAKARDRGAIIVSTNASYPQLMQKYNEYGFYTQVLGRFSSISGTSNGRRKQEELLITSYPVHLQ